MSSDRNPIVPDASTRLAAERTRLAYGRTLLGWIRTAVSLITFGFSIYQFFRITRRGIEESKYLIGPREFGMVMIAIGLLSLLIAVWEHRKAVRTLRLEYPDLPSSSERVLASMVGALGLLGLLVAAFRH